MHYYYLDEAERVKIERVMQRLYSQKRLDADEMRDAAHVLGGVLRSLVPAERTNAALSVS